MRLAKLANRTLFVLSVVVTGSVAGAFVWALLFVMNLGISFVWDSVGARFGIYFPLAACLVGGLEISQGVADIYSGMQAVLADDRAYIGCFGFPRVPGAEMAGEIMAETCGVKKTLDIACLTVADDVQRAAF